MGDVEVVTRDCIVQLSGMRMRDMTFASSLKWVCGEQAQAQVLSVSCWEGIYGERGSCCDIREQTEDEDERTGNQVYIYRAFLRLVQESEDNMCVEKSLSMQEELGVKILRLTIVSLMLAFSVMAQKIVEDKSSFRHHLEKPGFLLLHLFKIYLRHDRRGYLKGCKWRNETVIWDCFTPVNIC